MRRVPGRILQASFFAFLLSAPTLYASTQDPWRKVFLWVGGWVLVVWLLNILLRKHLPKVPIPFLLAGVLLLVQGWCMALNPEGVYFRPWHAVVPTSKKWPWLPGAADAAMATGAMATVTLGVGIAWLVCDRFSEEPETGWLQAWMVSVGLALCGLGILGRLFPWMILSRLWPGEAPGHEFGVFRYHGAAGAFLNVLWPLSLGQSLRAFRVAASGMARAFWVWATFLFGIGLFANASLGALLVAGVLLLGWLVFAWMQRPSALGVAERRQGPSYLGLGVGILFLALSVWLISLGVTQTAWRRHPVPWDPTRVRAWQLCLELLPKAGGWGFGPGCFEAVFGLWKFRKLGPAVAYRWDVAHQDYLQTMLEWGWLGFFVWALWVGGGLLGWLRKALARRSERAWAGFLALGGLCLHAFFDFPFQIPALQLYASVLVGLGWSFWTRKYSPAQQPETLGRGFARALPQHGL
jgi:hypothetical protein